MSTLASLRVALIGDISDFEQNMDKAHGIAGKAGKLIGGALAVGAGAALVGVAALGKGLADSVGEAMAAQEVQAQLAAVLKSTGGAAGVTADMANDLANNLSTVTRFEDDAILSGENMLLTFTGIGKDVFPQATQAMLDLSQATGQDLKSSALQLGKALNDPVQGMNALRRVGVSFSDDQEKVIKKLVETGDVAGAQKVMLDELQKEFGGSAVAAGQTFAGQMDILKNKFGNVKEEVGTALLPALTSLATTLGPVLISAAQGFATWAESSLIPMLQKLFEWLATNLPPAIQALANFWTGTLQPALATVWSFIQANILPVLQTIWTWLATNLPPAIQALANFWTTVLQPALQTIWTFIQTNIIPILQTIWTWLATNLPPAIQALANFWTTVLQPALQKVWNFIQVNIIPLLEALANVWIALVKTELRALAWLWENVLQPAIHAVWNFITEKLVPGLQGLADKFEFLRPIVDTIRGVFDAVGGAIGGIGAAIQDVIGWLQRMADKLNNIHLPDWLTPGSPTPFENGLRGIESALRAVDAAMPSEVSLRASSGGGAAAANGWAPVTINIYAAGGDPQAIGRSAEQGVLRARRAMGY